MSSSKSMFGMSEETQNMLHALAGLLYVCFLLCLTVFWPSVSLIFLLCAHVVMVVLLKMGQMVESMIPKSTPEKFGWWDTLSFHFCVEGNNWMNMIHLLILLANLVGYLSITHNEMPPSTILLGGERAFDHSKLGMSQDGLVNAPSTPIQDLVNNHNARGIKLAQRGYYYAEEYRGFFGMQAQTACTGASGWKCYAIGVRIFQSAGQRESSGDAEWRDTSIYQPLPTPAYDVDVQVEVAMGAGAGNCSAMQPIYIQHGNVIGPYRPVVDFAWKDAPDKTMCPGGLIGCIPAQRQSLVNYTSSLRSWCSENRVKHSEAEYTASYIRIPGAASTVDTSSGGIRHTIIIVNATIFHKPPMLRVTPKEILSGVPLRYFVAPVGPVPFPASGDATEFQEKEGNADSFSLIIGQKYGINAPIPELQMVDLPSDYLRKNFRAHMWLHLTFFLVPIAIAWYYLSTVVYEYDTKPFVYNATFVRGPLLLLGMYMGSLFYCLAQASIILSHTTRSRKRADSPRVLLPDQWVCIGFALLGVIFNIVHIVLWAVSVTPRMDLVSNALYLNEVANGVVFRAWGSNLLAPLVLVFMLVEPITTCASHSAFIVIGMWFRDMKTPGA